MDKIIKFRVKRNRVVQGMKQEILLTPCQCCNTEKMCTVTYEVEPTESGVENLIPVGAICDECMEGN